MRTKFGVSSTSLSKKSAAAGGVAVAVAGHDKSRSSNLISNSSQTKNSEDIFLVILPCCMRQSVQYWPRYSRFSRAGRFTIETDDILALKTL